uniref:glutamate racemase n=1 Tax=mine drainage metagenome TaxID=410659 RepID=E6PFI7_9ZZZZ
MLGLFDSGLGGLTVLRAVRAMLPDEEIVFLADQAHVPYGDRREEELVELLHANIAWLEAAGADAIVMACNTSCAVAQRHAWPPSGVRILDLIESAALAVTRRGLRNVAVIATAATVRTGAYGDALRARAPGMQVTEIAAPALVPLVEAGEIESERTRRAVAEVCEGVAADCEAVVLACTHFPVLDAHFASALGPRIARIDPALVQAERAVALSIEAGSARGNGRTRCVTTGDGARFAEQLEMILGPDPSRTSEAVRLEYGRDRRAR